MQEELVNESQNTDFATFLKFLVPSAIGVLLFMTPLMLEQGTTIPVALLKDWLLGLLGASVHWLVLGLICGSALLAVVAKTLKPSWICDNPFLNGLLNVSGIWFAVRLLGAVIALAVAFQWGPEFIWEGNTGGLVYNDLLPGLLAVFVFAGLLLPLLLDFGLLEFIGTLLTPLMRPVFGLPGRASIDCIASWLGDGTVGVLLTSKQYEARRYTQREAAVVCTCFSAVSITFCLVVLEQVNLISMFAQFYLTVCAAGIVAAIVLPKLPPLSRYADRFVDGSSRQGNEELIPEGHSSFSWGLHQALGRAAQVTSPAPVLSQGLRNVMDMLLGVLPIIMAVGTLALVIAEYTPVFALLGKPFVPLLELLQIPEAVAASQTMVVGFADMFVPSILAASIESDMTRFVIAALSVTQLIYMSEVGALMLGSKIPVNIGQLMLVFLLRTLVTLPVIALFAHLFF